MRPVTALALFAASALTIAAPSAGKAQTPNPYLKGDGSGDLEIGRVLSFGDSYSKLKRKTKFTNWVEQMRDEGEALSIAGYGVSGATAANVAVNGSTRTFRQQFNKWRNAGAAFRRQPRHGRLFRLQRHQ
jgi:hypothetical protein